MRLKHGSEAWREHLKVEITRLKDLLKQKQHPDHSRYYADSAIKSMAEAIGGIEGLRITFSLVRKEAPKITYHNEGRLSCGFYVHDDKLVHMSLRGDEYWEAAAAILMWFNTTGKRYMQKGETPSACESYAGESDFVASETAAPSESDAVSNPNRCDRCQSELYLVGTKLVFVVEGERGHIGKVHCQACKHGNVRRIINHINPALGRKEC